MDLRQDFTGIGAILERFLEVLNESKGFYMFLHFCVLENKRATVQRTGRVFFYA